MKIDTLKAEAGEVAWHDWCQSLKLRKPSAIGKDLYTRAFAKSKDAWHPEAFAGTGVEHLLAPVQEPRRVVFDAIDWCGNVIGQVEDCPFGPVGRVYEVQGLGIGPAGYRLTDYGLEQLPDGVWVWWLLFAYDKEAAKIIHQRDRDREAAQKPSA